MSLDKLDRWWRPPAPWAPAAPPPTRSAVEQRKAEVRAARAAVEAAEAKASADLERVGHHGAEAAGATSAKAKAAAQRRASEAFGTYRAELAIAEQHKRAEQRALEALADAQLAEAGDLTRRAEQAQRYALRFAASVRSRTETTPEL